MYSVAVRFSNSGWLAECALASLSALDRGPVDESVDGRGVIPSAAPVRHLRANGADSRFKEAVPPMQRNPAGARHEA
jgi:hypothetical protein